MRLLHQELNGSLALTDFPDDRLPPFAILSHTWGKEEDEIKYGDIKKHLENHDNQSATPAYVKKNGYRKVQFCIDQAAREGYHKVWIDTCCINKDSTAELNKAINWMYRWYAAAEKCYVYLEDVSTHKRTTSEDDTSQEKWKAAIRSSRWFTRGWTLQELLAPRQVDFHSKEGDFLGTKQSLMSLIRTVTGISVGALNGEDLSTISVQERFNWGLQRQTTEPEDRIYSLFGILGVSFPSNYGEGLQSALKRLRNALLDQYFGKLLVLDFHQDLQDPDRVRNIISVQGREAETADDSSWLRQLQASLIFEQKDLRRSNIQTHTAKTCEWLITHPLYERWRRCEIGRRLLWIKGKPGAGKSTIMKFLDIHSVVSKASRDIIISFYFNARGSRLERSVEGLYRSLLYQLVAAIDASELTGLASALANYNIPSPGSSWPIETLQIFFSAIANSLQDRRLTLFIDALDECKDDDVRQTLYFLEDLDHSAAESNREMLMCFASRYYPTITLADSLDLRLEAEHGHKDDLAKHVAKALRVGSYSKAAELREQLLIKANGVFIWAVLVIRILNDDYESGRVLDMSKKLDSLPADMGDLFKGIITRDNKSIDEFVLCLQWILHAERPMTSEEFYFAMMAGTIEWNTIFKCDPITQADVRRYVSNCSKGLVEVTDGSHTTVQFIHETVRDFLLEGDGLRIIWTSNDDFKSASHERLRVTCTNCIQAFLNLSDHISRLSCEKTDELTPWAFVRYAMSTVLFHSERAAQIFPQNNFLFDYAAAFDEGLNELLAREPSSRSSIFDGFLHLLVKCDALHLLKTSTAMFPVDGKDHLLEQTPFQMACSAGQIDVAKLLIDSNANIDAQDSNGDTALMLAIRQKRSFELISMLLAKGATVDICNEAGVSAWSEATLTNRLDVIDLLLNTDGEATSLIAHLEILHLAVDARNLSLIKKLFFRKAAVNAKDSAGRTPLHRIFQRGAYDEASMETIMLLMRHGARLDAADEDGRTALHHAVQQASLDVVMFLLDQGADTTATDSGGFTALHLACQCDASLSVIQLLVRHGSPLKAVTNMEQTALHIASCSCSTVSTIEWLMIQGAELEKRDLSDRTVLLLACEKSADIKNVMFLLDKGANINAADNEGYTVLMQVVLHHYNLGQLMIELLSRGVNVNATNHRGETVRTIVQEYPRLTLSERAEATAILDVHERKQTREMHHLLKFEPNWDDFPSDLDLY